MSLKLEAQTFCEKVEQTESLLWRMKKNRAYDVRNREEVERLYDKISQQSLLIPGLVEQIDLWDLQHPLQISPDLSLKVTSLQHRFKREVEEPLADILGNVEGSVAKNRWFPSESKPDAPRVVQVRERWAMLVGVSNYGEVGLKSLSTPSSDARALHDLLLSDHRYGYLPEHTRKFIDGEAQRSDILSAVEQFAQAADSDDMLFFYFSGHGDLQDGEAVLIPYDYKRASPKDSAVPVAEVMELMRASRAPHKIVILDACHSGPDIPLGDEEKKDLEEEMGMNPGFERRVFEQARGSALIASCVAKQVSWTYRAQGLSAFTYFLCEGLRGNADFSHRGFVTVSDAFYYVADKVQQWAEQKNLKQTPALDYRATGEIILMDSR